MNQALFDRWSTVFVFTEILVCFLGISLNGIVIFTLGKNINRKISASSYFILSMAVSDFLSCALAVPLAIARHFQGEWPLGKTGCKAHAFMIFLLALVSITHLVVISLGKYLTITKSLSRDSYFNRRNVVLLIVGSWMYSLVFSVPPLLGWSKYGLEGINMTCSVQWKSSAYSDWAYFGVVISSCFFLPLFVIISCYYKIHRVSRQIVANTSRRGGIAITASRALMKRHRKSAMYFLIIIAAFLMPWLPYATVAFLLALGHKVNPIATSACSVFAKISFFLNPMLYGIVQRKFRRRFIHLVPLTRRNRSVKPWSAVLPPASQTLVL
ncbi:melanopsin-B-like [Stylophora pistillata]|uniref:melanopsin-B-like n=1 Tax=Stylophora pistillata TaxID=50429 RepID=UPI000C04193F|nr:melanopsin-B-like [Stylophora pistillata]